MQSLPNCVVGSEGQTPPEIPDLIVAALMSAGRLIKQRLKGEGIDPGTWWLLHKLSMSDPIRSSDLAATVGLDTSTVSRHVQQLSKRGLIERSPDPIDGRAQRVQLTPAGRALLDDALERRRQTLRERLIDWDSHDIEELARLLTKLVESMEQTTSEVEHEL